MARFWSWLYAFAERRILAGFREGLNLRCPHCHTWTAVVMAAEWRRNEPDIEHDTMICGRCGYPSTWDCVRSMIPFLSPADQRFTAALKENADA